MESANTLNTQVTEKGKLLAETHFHYIKNKGEKKRLFITFYKIVLK